MITITVNGKPAELDGPIGLMDFLQRLKVNFRFLAVGYNGEVVSKTEYNHVTLKDGDVLEIVRPIGGGTGLSPLGLARGGPAPFRAEIAWTLFR